MEAGRIKAFGVLMQVGVLGALASCNAVFGIEQYGPGPFDDGGLGAADEGAESDTGKNLKDGEANRRDGSLDSGDSTASDDSSDQDSTASQDMDSSGDDVTTPEPDAPRPIAPLSTSRVTSQRPTLRWELPSGVTQATVELCKDRACDKPIGTSVLVTGTSYAPTTALPAGVVYWRLHPSTVTSVSSPTWQFTVGARSATVSTSWGTTLDVNGDGYADLVVGAEGATTAAGSYTGRVYVYLGSATGIGTTPATILTGPDGENGQFGYSVASAGDVNGDGYADLVVGANGVASSAGRVYVYHGSASGLRTTPATTLTGTDGSSSEFGFSVASAGDVNGDGYADVVIGAYGASSYTGHAYVFLGSASGLGTTPAATLIGPAGANGLFGTSVASAGDVNGDGYADLVVGADGVASETGSAYVYLGSASGLATTPATTLPGSGGSFGFSVASAGDVNGDGYADVVVGAFVLSSGVGSAYVYSGSAAGTVLTPATTLNGMDGMNGDFGISVASAGDVNGDGYGDVIIGSSGAMNGTGAAYVFPGSATGLVAASVQPVTMNYIAAGEFGNPVSGAGDVNGDGFSDVVVGATGVASNTGNVFVYLGGSQGGTDGPAATTLVGPDGMNGFFGYSVFGASD
jgi:hypothetical protein